MAGPVRFEEEYRLAVGQDATTLTQSVRMRIHDHPKIRDEKGSLGSASTHFAAQSICANLPGGFGGL